MAMTDTQFLHLSVVGHLPREYSKLAWYFLQHNGQIKCQVTGLLQVAGKGVVVPCVYIHVYRKASHHQETYEIHISS